MMSLDAQESSLYGIIARLPVIDAHEHLPDEQDYLARPVDVFQLFAQHLHDDLLTAGMSPADYDSLADHGRPLDERWARFSPYWRFVRHTGYARAARIAARDLYGLAIDDYSYAALSERIAAAHAGGLYDRLLRERCNIEFALNQSGKLPAEEHRGLLVPVMGAAPWTCPATRRMVQEREQETGESLGSLKRYVEALGRRLQTWKDQGVVGLKIFAREIRADHEPAARRAFDTLPERAPQEVSCPPELEEHLLHQALEFAADLGLVVAVHCGLIWTNWGDFRESSPLPLVTTLAQHQRTRFDLYHAGLPWAREMGVIGKSFPNAWLNLCWAHLVSPQLTRSALDEWLDLVPFNKLIAFGGDYGVVEKVYGHLTMAREDWALVLAGRCKRGLLTEEEAVEIAKRAFYDNAKALYGL